jgi:hypothetical protein
LPLLSQINCLQQLQVQFGAINNMNECYMKMSTVVYSIKQQQKIMCFLLPVDSKPAADKCPKINQKLPLKSNNVEFLRYCGGHFENGDR